MIKQKLKSLTRKINTPDGRRLTENFISLSLLQGANYLLPLLTFPYLVRVLGAEKFGLLAFATAMIAYFMIITDYGFNLSATREVSIHRDDRDKLIEIFSAVMTIKFALMILSLLMMTILVLSFDKFRAEWNIYYLTFGMVVGQVLFPVWFFQGMERMKYITILNIIAKVIFTVAIFMFVRSDADYWMVPVFNSLGFIIAGVISLYLIMKDFKIRLGNLSIYSIKWHLQDSSQYFLSRVSVSAFTSSNIMILGLFATNTIIGYYSIAEKLYIAIQSLYIPINQALYPYIVKVKNLIVFKKIFIITMCSNFILCFGLYLFGDSIFVFLFKTYSVVSLSVFNILLISSIFMVPAVLIGYPLLGAFGSEKIANNSVIYASIIHIISLVVLSLFQVITVYTVSVLTCTTTIILLTIRVKGVIALIKKLKSDLMDSNSLYRHIAN
jgi:PST family polysaccharide transporter